MKGKLIGAILGGLAAGPWGAALGLAAGHIFDSAASAVSGSATGGGTETGHIPLSLFSAISKLAKIDGQISEAEIDAIERIFKDLNFSSETRSQAIECFRRAKTAHVCRNPAAACRRLYKPRSPQSRICRSYARGNRRRIFKARSRRRPASGRRRARCRLVRNIRQFARKRRRFAGFG